MARHRVRLATFLAQPYPWPAVLSRSATIWVKSVLPHSGVLPETQGFLRQECSPRLIAALATKFRRPFRWARQWNEAGQ